MSEKIKLGESAVYSDEYDSSLLVPIPRETARDGLANKAFLEFMQGKDIWQAYELSWLSPSGKPRVSQAVFEFDCKSEAIIESKSFKYYLNSYNQSSVANETQLVRQLVQDLSSVCGSPVSVTLEAVDAVSSNNEIEGYCVDQLEANGFSYTPDETLLATEARLVVNDCLYSHLLRSNCPVTGQPDWASLWISYSGKMINPLSFLKYVVSYRQHQDFHENCVEKIYCDLMATCQPEKLSVYARYTRRGGLDINPFRSNHESVPAIGFRTSRQ